MSLRKEESYVEIIIDVTMGLLGVMDGCRWVDIKAPDYCERQPNTNTLDGAPASLVKAAESVVEMSFLGSAKVAHVRTLLGSARKLMPSV